MSRGWQEWFSRLTTHHSRPYLLLQPLDVLRNRGQSNISATRLDRCASGAGRERRKSYTDPIYQILKSARPVPIARRGESWSEACLGPEAKNQGVYVIFHGDKVIYIGKTDGPSMSFGMKLRREFQETASGGRHIYPKLAALATPPIIQASMLSTHEIRKLVSLNGLALTDADLIPPCEAVLIAAYKPIFQV